MSNHCTFFTYMQFPKRMKSVDLRVWMIVLELRRMGDKKRMDDKSDAQNGTPKHILRRLSSKNLNSLNPTAGNLSF